MKPTNLLLLLLHYYYYGRYRGGYCGAGTEKSSMQDGPKITEADNGVSASTSIKRLTRFACLLATFHLPLI